MANHAGASHSEQLLAAARGNNMDLYRSVVNSKNYDTSQLAGVVNKPRDSFGNTVLHLAAQSGAAEMIDDLLDIEGFEVDPTNRLDGDTPLHLAVRYAAEKDKEVGTYMVDLLVEAGADPRIKNKAGMKPIDLIPRWVDVPELRETLQGGELALQLEEEEEARKKTQPQILDDGGEASGSESPSDSDDDEPMR